LESTINPDTFIGMYKFWFQQSPQLMATKFDKKVLSRIFEHRL
jgi:hypothetical protein